MRKSNAFANSNFESSSEEIQPFNERCFTFFFCKKEEHFLKVDAFKTLETQAALTGSQAFATLSRTLQVWHGWSQERRT